MVEVTLIGVICLIACVLVAVRPMDWGLLIFGLFLPLQTAAAFNLWAVGGVSIICSHLIIGAFMVGLAFRPKMASAVLRDVSGRPAVFIFGLFVLYAVVSAIILPRLFEGSIDVYSLERAPDGVRRAIPLVNLHPTTGNLTQSVYMTANFALFAFLAFAIARANGVRNAMIMLNAATVTHLIFGALSVLYAVAPVAVILETIRTANYAILQHHTMGGLARVIGSYAEASAFGSMSLGLFAYNALRFLQTRGLWFLVSSLSLIAAVIFSFSTTAYAGLALMVLLWSLHTSFVLIRRGLKGDQLVGFFLCIAIAAAVVFLLLFEPSRAFADQLYLRLFGQKLQSASGVERSMWNMQGLRNLIESGGLGVGLGSARTSSLVTVLLSNVGVFGALLYAAFLGASFLKPWPKRLRPTSSPGEFRAQRMFAATRAGAIAMLITHIIAGGNIDGGLQFFVFAATAAGVCAAPRRKLSTQSQSLFPVGEKFLFPPQPAMEFQQRPQTRFLFARARESESG
ncbi:MAG: hypothetical protein WD076_09110 [Parvularculaceae bacterium]